MHLHHHTYLAFTKDFPGLAHPVWAPRRARERSESRDVVVALFSCFFAAQSGQLALTPVLTRAAGDLGLSTAGAGQIRSAAAVVAAAVAVALVAGVSRIRLRALLWVGLALIAAGSTLSFVAGSVGVLLAGQAFTGAASSIVMAAGVAAAAAWSDPASRGRVVAWTLIGAPTAWVVAMPVIGLAARADWHLAFAVPAAAAGAAGVALARVRARGAQPVESSLRSVLSHRSVQAWTIGEMLAYAAWSGVLVYVGALFVESYGASLSRVGIALGLGAAAYLPGPFVAQRLTTVRNRRPLLAAVTLVLALATVAFGTLRVGPTFTAVGFGVLCFLGGTRVYLGSTVGLDLAGDRHAAAMSIRAAAAQVGWILGGVTGGAALAVGGYSAMGLVLGALFAAGALLHARALTAFIPRASARATRPELLRRAADPAEAR